MLSCEGDHDLEAKQVWHSCPVYVEATLGLLDPMSCEQAIGCQTVKWPDEPRGYYHSCGTTKVGNFNFSISDCHKVKHSETFHDFSIMIRYGLPGSKCEVQDKSIKQCLGIFFLNFHFHRHGSVHSHFVNHSRLVAMGVVDTVLFGPRSLRCRNVG